MKIETPLVLCVISGWGIAPPDTGNAFAEAQTPNFDRYVRSYPAANISSPQGEPLSAAQAHTIIGSGRLVRSEQDRILQEVLGGRLSQRENFTTAISQLGTKNAVHILGIIGPGGVHGGTDLMVQSALAAQESGAKRIYIHVISDGIDASPRGVKTHISECEELLKEKGVKAKIVTILGRSFAMDMTRSWEQTNIAYMALTSTVNTHSTKDLISAIGEQYDDRVIDSELKPITVLGNSDYFGRIRPGDMLLYANIRGEGMHQLLQAFSLPHFSKFPVEIQVPSIKVYTLCEYDSTLPVVPLYPSQPLSGVFGKVLEDAELTQLHMAETSRFPHVTYYFNGFREQAFEGETDMMISSNTSARSFNDLVKKVQSSVHKGLYDVYIISIPHIDIEASRGGSKKALIKEIERVDTGVRKIVDSVLQKQGTVVLTSDHGNAEQMLDIDTQEKHTKATKNPVPFILISEKFEGVHAGFPEPVGPDLSLVPAIGTHADIAPTVLSLMGLDIPAEMTGSVLIHGETQEDLK